MTEERGLAQATVTTAGAAPQVPEIHGRQNAQADAVGRCGIFLAHLGEQGWTRHGINAMAYIIRGFFKYAETQRWTRPGIGAEIHGPRVYSQEFLPLGPSWPDVQRLLASTETDYPYDIRDRPILLLLAVYGMRIGEVRRIRLCDVDWDNRTLTIPLTKQRRARICPVIPMLAEALERYVREVRPKCQSEALFLRLRAPHRQFTRWRAVCHRRRSNEAAEDRVSAHRPSRPQARLCNSLACSRPDVNGSGRASGAQFSRLHARVREGGHATSTGSGGA